MGTPEPGNTDGLDPRGGARAAAIRSLTLLLAVVMACTGAAAGPDSASERAGRHAWRADAGAWTGGAVRASVVLLSRQTDRPERTPLISAASRARIGRPPVPGALVAGPPALGEWLLDLPPPARV